MSRADAAVAYSDTNDRVEPPRALRQEAGRTSRFVRRYGAPFALASLAIATASSYRPKLRAPAIDFETAVVGRGPLAAKVTATGTVSALVTVSVGSQVSGRIDKLFVDFGSTVRRGQTVATIDSAFFRAAVAEARANHAAAKAAVDSAEATALRAKRHHARALELHAFGLSSWADLEAAEAELNIARANTTAAQAGVVRAAATLDQAELNLKYTTIVSPIDGIVISRSVDVGQTVAAALHAPTLLLIAQDLTRMQVDTRIAEADVGRIHAGMPVTFSVGAHPQKTFAGVVRQVRDNAQKVDDVVTYVAVIDVDNSERLLKPGMTANVTVVYAMRDNAIRLPKAALRFQPDAALLAALLASQPQRALPGNVEAAQSTARVGEGTVWVRRGFIASPLTVRFGISDGSFTEVVGGELMERDHVILSAARKRTAEPLP